MRRLSILVVTTYLGSANTGMQVFEAIDKLEFQEDLTVTAMYSEETERIQFKNTFNPKSAGGNVERWLIDCENSMRESIAGKLDTRAHFDQLMVKPGC